MTDVKTLSYGECIALGFTFPCEEIRGAPRGRIVHKSGCVGGIIAAGPKGGWQNAHHSVHPDEVAAVHRGWIAIATPSGAGVEIKILKAGDSFVMPPNYPHNTYLGPGSVLAYLKFGDCRPGDWVADPELDRLTKMWTEEEILRLGTAV